MLPRGVNGDESTTNVVAATARQVAVNSRNAAHLTWAFWLNLRLLRRKRGGILAQGLPLRARGWCAFPRLGVLATHRRRSTARRGELAWQAGRPTGFSTAESQRLLPRVRGSAPGTPCGVRGGAAFFLPSILRAAALWYAAVKPT